MSRPGESLDEYRDRAASTEISYNSLKVSPPGPCLPSWADMHSSRRTQEADEAALHRRDSNFVSERLDCADFRLGRLAQTLCATNGVTQSKEI